MKSLIILGFLLSQIFHQDLTQLKYYLQIRNLLKSPLEAVSILLLMKKQLFIKNQTNL